MLNVCSILQSDLIKSESLIAIRCHGKRGGKRERTIILQKKLVTLQIYQKFMGVKTLKPLIPEIVNHKMI